MSQGAKLDGLRGYDLGRLLGSRGRRGDTMVAHISPLEAMILQLLGGAGTRNPATGLPEFYMSGTVGAADRAAANSGTALGGGRGGNGGIANVGSKYGNENAAIGTFGNTTAERNSMYGGTRAVSAAAGAGSVNTAMHHPYSTAYEDMSAALSQLNEPGFIERNLFDLFNNGITIDKYGRLATSIGFDPASLIGTVAGFGLGVPGLGSLAGIVSDQLGHPLGFGIGTRAGFNSSLGAGSGSSNSAGPAGPGGGPGNHSGSTLAAAQRANTQQTNAGGGAVAAPSAPIGPPPTTQPNLPVGLLAYLAQNPGILQGYATSSRFGPGSVAPVNYLRTLA